MQSFTYISPTGLLYSAESIVDNTVLYTLQLLRVDLMLNVLITE